VFNIDPVGCEDVDDILAYRVTPTGTQWLIGIADVAAFVPEGSPMDLVAAKRGQTLYDNGTVVAPMLPNIVSTGLASLRCDGARRPVIGLVVTVPLEGAARCESLELHQIIVTHSYSYESVPTDVGKHVASLSAALGAVSSDPHVWIETVMVAYNCHVAHLLRTAGVGLLRRLSAGTGYVEIAEASGCPEIAFLGRAAGEYCSASEEDIAHAGLGVAEYCHASSPLRRYADLVNQRCLHALLWGGKALSVGAAYLNHRAFVSRRMERDLWFLERVPIGAISTTKGIAIDSDSVYCAEWKRVVNVFSDTLLIPGSSVIVRAYIDPASPRRRVVCQATAAAAAST
jgi:exoribonuclease II